MEAGANLEQRSDATTNGGTSARRIRDARHQLEQGRLARAVSTDQPNDLALVDLERDVLQRPEFTLRRFDPVVRPPVDYAGEEVRYILGEPTVSAGCVPEDV